MYKNNERENEFSDTLQACSLRGGDKSLPKNIKKLSS